MKSKTPSDDDDAQILSTIIILVVDDFFNNIRIFKGIGIVFPRWMLF